MKINFISSGGIRLLNQELNAEALERIEFELNEGESVFIASADKSRGAAKFELLDITDYVAKDFPTT